MLCVLKRAFEVSEQGLKIDFHGLACGLLNFVLSVYLYFMYRLLTQKIGKFISMIKQPVVICPEK